MPKNLREGTKHGAGKHGPLAKVEINFYMLLTLTTHNIARLKMIDVLWFDAAPGQKNNRGQ